LVRKNCVDRRKARARRVSVGFFQLRVATLALVISNSGVCKLRGLIFVSALCLPFLTGCHKLFATAMLEDLRGEVLVGNEGGFIRVSNASKVGVGANVMTLHEGRAVIAYADGCKVAVGPGSLVTVADFSPCAVAAMRAGSGKR
jgi:hypothetical protein